MALGIPQHHGQNGGKENHHEAVEGVEVAVNGGTVLPHLLLELQGQQDANGIIGHSGKAANHQHKQHCLPLPQHLQNGDGFRQGLFVFPIALGGFCVLPDGVFRLDEEENQHGGHENGEAVDEKRQIGVILKQDAAHAGTVD